MQSYKQKCNPISIDNQMAVFNCPISKKCNPISKKCNPISIDKPSKLNINNLCLYIHQKMSCMYLGRGNDRKHDSPLNSNKIFAKMSLLQKVKT